MNYKKTLMSLGLACLASLGAVAQKPIKVACVGNSITAGLLLKDPKTESYPSRLQAMLGSGYEVGNFGHSGATLLSQGHKPYIQTEEFKKALAFDADIVIIHLGLNDTDPRNWPNYAQNFERDYLRLIDTLGGGEGSKKQFYIAKLSPLTPGHRRYYSSSRDWFKEVNEVIKDVQGKYTLLDFSIPFDGRWHLFPDALHPNAEGANLIAEYVYKSISKPQKQSLWLHPYYRDNMILQKGTAHIKGKATPGHRLSYQIGKEGKKSLIVAQDGTWSIPVTTNSYTSFDLKIEDAKTKEKKHIRNIQVGEVWIASGQSNMAMQLRETKDFKLSQAPKDELLQYVDMPVIARTDNVEWTQAILDSVNAFRYYGDYQFSTAADQSALPTWSAVAYHFGRKLRDSLDCPVAIIHNAVGGSPIESWISPQRLQDKYPDILHNWLNKDYAQEWVKGRTKKNIALRPDAQTHPYAPSYLYMAGWEPIKDIPHKGMIWYQGESNAHAPELYAKYFEDLRAQTAEVQADKRAHLYAVQLSSIDRPSWVHFRTQQAQPAELYVPSYDKGDSLDVHPPYKAAIGERLALRALERSYARPIKSAAPRITSAIVSKERGNEVVIYAHVVDAWGGLKSEGEGIKGLELLLSDGRTIKAEKVELISKPEKGTALIVISQLPKGKYVRLSYAAEAFTRANIYGGNGMPLMPINGCKVQPISK